MQTDQCRDKTFEEIYERFFFLLTNKDKIVSRILQKKKKRKNFKIGSKQN